MATTDRLPSPELLTPARGQLAAPGAQIVDAEFSEAPPRHLREYLWVLLKYRWLVLTCFLLTVGLTTLVTLLAPRFYTASTRLQLASQSPIQLRLQENVLRVDNTDRDVNGTSSFLATQVEALQSRDLAERVIRGQRLADDEAFLRPRPGRQGFLSVSGRLLSLFRPRGWESGPPSPGGEGAAPAPSNPALLNRYMGYLKVRDVRGTDLVEVSFTTPSPSLSAFLAAAHTQAYMEANEEARRATDVTAKEFLARQLRESREQVERAEAALSRFAAEHPAVAVNQEQKIVGQRITELSSLLTRAEGLRVTMQSRYEFLSRPEGEPLAYLLDRPGIQKLHLSLLDLRAQRAALSNRLDSKHPQMVELGRQEAEIQQQLHAEVEQEVAAVRSHYDAALLREEQLHRKLAMQQEASVELRDLGARYDLLKNEVEGARGLHGSLLKQQMETAVNSELAASNIRVIERAELPERPSRPKVPLNLTLGALGGLVFALGAAFLCDYFDNSVKSSEEVEELLQIPSLAMIPNFILARRRRQLAYGGAGDGNGAGSNGGGASNGFGGELVVLREPRSPAAEAFRALRTAILFSAPGAPPKVILVTSAGASEGKTVSSLNLATSLAEAGSRVLLLDGDLRRPGCHRALGLENDRGLSNFLAGQADLGGVIHALDAPRLFFVPAGPAAPNPAELVGSVRMRDTLEELRDAYDFIILDSPPVLPVTDAVILAREADGVVLVVKGDDTPRELVRRARDLLIQANPHLLGAVVNNVDVGWGGLYFYSRYYGGYYHAEPPAREEHA